MQAPSCEHKTVQRTLFLSFAINNCYQAPNIGWKIVDGIWINFGGFFTIVKPPLGKCLLICLADFYMCITDHCRWSNYSQYWWGTFAKTPNVGRIFRVIWKDLSWTADSYTMPLFANNYWMQMTENRGSLSSLGLGACTDLFENLSEITLKRDQSNATTFIPPLSNLSAVLWIRI